MIFGVGIVRGSRVRQASIRKYANANPGVHVAQMARDLAIPRTSLIHHLSQLRRQGVVHLIDHGRNLRVIPSTSLHVALDELVAMAYPDARRARDLLMDGAPRGLLEIGNALDLSRKQVTTTLQRLLVAGVVSKETQFRGRYFIESNNPDGGLVPQSLTAPGFDPT